MEDPQTESEPAHPRRVIITGGASGIGAATAARFVKDQAAVAIIDRSSPARDAEGSCVFVRADVRDWQSTQAGVDVAAQELGGIDVLVCGAGITHRGTIAETEPESWDDIFAVNARGVYLSARVAMPYLVNGSAPAVVVIASQLGLVASPANAAYCASKGAVIQLTRAMAIDAITDGVRVNAVCPGATRTPMTMRHYAAEGDKEDQRRQLINRLIEPSEIAEAIFYVASPQASALVGAVVVVDGGYTIH